MNYARGFKFEDGYGGGYVVTRDISFGDEMLHTDFEAYGGQPKIVSSIDIPHWLARQLNLYWDIGHKGNIGRKS